MDDLSSFFDTLREKQGSTDEWLHKQHSLIKFVANLDQTVRVLADGQWRDNYYYPAVLVYDKIHKQARVYYVEYPDKPLKMTLFFDKFFSNNHFKSACREIVLSNNKNSTV